MSLRTSLGLSRESSLEEGTPDEVMAKKRRALDEQVRPARLEVARRNPKWIEIENDLVPRARGWLVSAKTDAIYTPVRGVVFAAHSVNVIADQAELAYYVDRDGELHFLERIPGTWTNTSSEKRRSSVAARCQSRSGHDRRRERGARASAGERTDGVRALGAKHDPRPTGGDTVR